MQEQFWDEYKARWDSHAAFNTVSHDHIYCYWPAEGYTQCELTLVECADGRWYIEDSWGDDAKGAERVWNPHDRHAGEPHFFGNEDEARTHAVAVVARICGVPEQAIREAM